MDCICRSMHLHWHTITPLSLSPPTPSLSISLSLSASHPLHLPFHTTLSHSLSLSLSVCLSFCRYVCLSVSHPSLIILSPYGPLFSLVVSIMITHSVSDDNYNLNISYEIQTQADRKADFSIQILISFTTLLHRVCDTCVRMCMHEYS